MLQQYPVKIVLALLKSLEGRRDFFKFLLHNGYPELAAFSNAVRGDEEALFWLFNHKSFSILGMLSNAIDGEASAVEWIKKKNDPFLIHFVGACRKNSEAIVWLHKKDLKIFILLAKEINKVLDLQVKENTFWYKIKF